MTDRRVLRILVVSALAACGDNTSTNPPPPQPDAGASPDGAVVEIPLEREHAGGSPTSIKVIGRRAS